MSTSSVGKAGELRVASELLLRGHLPLLSIVDDGVDIYLIGSNTTLQVKTAQFPSAAGYYTFTFHVLHERREPDGSRRKKQKMAADFAVLWCVGYDRFYIMPADAVGDRYTINIPDKETQSMWNQWRERWDLLGGD